MVDKNKKTNTQIKTKIDEILKWVETSSITVKDIKIRYGMNNSEIHNLLDMLKESGLITVSYSLFSFDKTKIISSKYKPKKTEKIEPKTPKEVLYQSEQDVNTLNKRISTIKKDCSNLLNMNKKRLDKLKKEKNINFRKIENETNFLSAQVNDINKSLEDFKKFIQTLKKRK